MKGKKLLMVVGLLAAGHLATVAAADAGADRIRCRVRDGRASIDVDARATNGLHTVKIVETSPGATSQEFSVTAARRELDFSGDTVAGQDPYLLDSGFGDAAAIKVYIDGVQLLGPDATSCTQ